MINLFAITFSLLVLVSNAQDTPSLRGLGRGGGGKGGRGGGGGGGRGGGGGGGRGEGHGGGWHGSVGRGKGKGGDLFSMIKGNCYWGANESQPLLDRLEEECAANDPCGNVAPGQLDFCANPSWETMNGEGLLVEGCPEEGLTEELKEDIKTKMQAKKEMWMNMTDDERMEYKKQKEDVKEANSATMRFCGCCKGSQSIASLVEGKEGAVAKTLGFRRPRGDGKDGDMDSTLEENCPGFLQKDGCAKVEEEAGGHIDCDWFDSVTVKRGRRPKSKLYCGCGCNNPDDPSDPVHPDDFSGD